MKKIGRPKLHKTQNRISISFSDAAWKILESVKKGKRSELISVLVEMYTDRFPRFLSKPEKK